MNKKGFTLGEVVTTVAIIGTLTAVAVPNYLRIKMNVNMEMVKQHLKTMGGHLNDIYNRDRTFPENILNLPGNRGEEISITASLNAINGKEYTTDGYLTNDSQSTYTFRTCPQEGRLGIAGDRCFLLDTSGIRELQPWEGLGVAMSSVRSSITANLLLIALSNQSPPLSASRQAEILALLIEIQAYASSAMMGSWNQNNFINMNTILPSSSIATSEANAAQVRALFPEISQILQSKGIEPYFREVASSSQSFDQVQHFEIGFRLENEVTSMAEFDLRSTAPSNALQQEGVNLNINLTSDSLSMGVV